MKLKGVALVTVRRLFPIYKESGICLYIEKKASQYERIRRRKNEDQIEKETLGTQESSMDDHGSMHDICVCFYGSFFHLEWEQKNFPGETE